MLKKKHKQDLITPQVEQKKSSFEKNHKSACVSNA